MSRAPVPVGTRVKRSNGRWQVKVAPGEWKWEPRPSRKRKGRVVAFEVSHREWAAIQGAAQRHGLSVSAFASWVVIADAQVGEEWDRQATRAFNA